MLEAYEEYEKVYRTIKREAEEEIAERDAEIARLKEEIAALKAGR